MPKLSAPPALNRIADDLRKAIADTGPRHWAITGGVAGIVVVALIGFLLLRGLDQRVERLQAEIKALRGQAATTACRVDELTREQQNVQADVGRIEDRIGPTRDPARGVDLTDSEKRTVLSFFNLRSQVIGPPKWKVGEFVPEGLLKPMPEDLLKMVPALRGTKYAFDLYGYVVIADAFRHRVLALIPLG
jgi:hypothetical protein